VKVTFAVAPNFQCKGSWADRLLVAEADGWRAPDETEMVNLTLNTPPADGAACSRLFSVPMHMRTRFWAMLDEEAAEGSGDFVYFSDDLAEFLTFKDLPPPKEAVCELILQNAVGRVTTDDAWALINFGEEPVVLAWPQLQLRLDPGEGLQTALECPPDVVPPVDDELNVLLAVRLAAA
jgi:hypothetical protein